MKKKRKRKKGEGREERGEREYNIINCGAHISKIIKIKSLGTLL